MNIAKVHHIAIICSDYKRSLDFYTNVLGLAVASEHYRAGRQSYKTDLALGGDCIIELFSFPKPPPRVTNPEAAGLRHLAFQVDDFESTLAELDAKGVEHEDVRIDEYTGKRFFFMRDPDDLPIEIYEAWH